MRRRSRRSSSIFSGPAPAERRSVHELPAAGRFARRSGARSTGIRRPAPIPRDEHGVDVRPEDVKKRLSPTAPFWTFRMGVAARRGDAPVQRWRAGRRRRLPLSAAARSRTAVGKVRQEITGTVFEPACGRLPHTGAGSWLAPLATGLVLGGSADLTAPCPSPSSADAMAPYYGRRPSTARCGHRRHCASRSRHDGATQVRLAQNSSGPLLGAPSRE